MKKLSNLLNFWRWIVLCIFSISYSAAKSQCRIECNTNAGIYSDNNARTIAYDNMGSGFHSTFVSEKNGFRVWGENMQNNGTSHHLSPVIINSTNYPALTGTVYFVGLGSYSISNVQMIVLTSTGLFASGTPGAVLSTSIKSTSSFSKLTINGKTDGLPTGITPDSVKMLFVTDWTIIITTCGGRVFVISQDVNVRGNGGGGSATTWSQVMQTASVPLTGVIAARGASGVGFALKSDSTIWTWGDNVLLGNSSGASNSSYALQMTKPSGVGAIKMIQATLNNWATTPAVSYFILGADQKVYSLGANNFGQLGDRTTTARLVWVNALNTNNTVINNAAWISANEHDAIHANMSILKSNSQMLTFGNNNAFMIGRTTNSGTNHPDFPTGIASNDTILFCEVGGHTSAFIKYNVARYGYVGHHINGSIGNNSSTTNTLTSVNFAIPPVINVCGTRCDTPKIYGKPFNCNDSIMYFVIKSKSGNMVKYQINNNPTDSVIIGISDSVILTLTNIGASQTLKILKVENIACNLSVAVNDTLKFTTRKDSFRTICRNQSVVFNGNILNTTGVYRDTFVNSKGCDSFLVLNLTVNDTTKKDSFLAICRYNPIVFNGQTLSTSGVYRDTFVNARGCDSFLYLHLTVNDTSRKDSFRTICKNQPIIFNGNSLNISGIYRDTFVNSKGCDSFLVLNLTVNDTTKKDSFRTICKNQSMVFNGQTLSTTGVYRDTFMNSKGCDSFLYLHLTVNDTTRKDSFRTICKNQPITFNGNILNTTGIYKDTFVNAKGCDSFLYLHLTVNDTTKKDSFLTICRYNPIIFNGQTLSTSGVYRDTFVNARGCDSFLYLHLTVNDTSRKDSFRTICKNQPIIFNGNSLNITGIYHDTFVNSKGCDSFLVLTLTVNDTTKKDSFRTICKNQSVVFNGQTLNTTGVYRDTFLNSKGCDSFLYLHLTVNDTTRKDSFRTICRNQSVVFNGNILNTTGVYRDTFVNSIGCDSFLVLNLTVNDTTKKDSFLAICRYNPIVFNGQTLSTSGVYRDTFVNARGCDSFLYLHLTVNDTSRKDSFRTICKNQPIIFNGNSLNISGIYRDTFVNSKGCDSFLVLNLIVNDTTKKDSFRTICKNQMVTFNGQNLNTTGIYRDTFLNSKGCDSFLYLHLTVNDTTRKDSFRTICKNQPITFNGNILNTTGIYKDTFINAKGCDSFLYLHLTVNDTTKKDSFLAICRYNPIVFNGQNLSTSGVYRDTFVNARGCDSFLYLHLTVNDTSRKDSFRTICKNQPIIFNGNSLNISGVYRDTFINAKGCDSFLVLNLIVNDTTKKDSFRTICKNQSVVFNGQTLNTTGVYRDTFMNSKGCDSFLYLHLTVNDTTRKDSFRTICKNQPITFNGNILNTTGIYKDTFINAKGCDSFLYLHLTVNDTTNYFFTKNICQGDSFYFNSNFRLNGGNFKDTLINIAGCDSFVYLQLIVNPLPIANAGRDTIRINCSGDSVQLGSASISNHSYRWFPDLNLSNGRIAQPYSKVASTTTYYMIIVNDITNCENTDTIKITVRESQMEVESITYNLKCKNSRDGMINLQAKKGFAPYQYKLSQMVYQDSGLFKNLPAGFNQYTVRDMKSCLFSDTFSLAEPTAIETVSKIRKHLTCYQSNDGEIEIIISGGTRPYSYLWTPSGDKDSILKNLSATTYSLVLLDSNKCYYTDTVVLSEPPPIVIQDTIQKRNPCFGDSLGSIEVKLAGGTQPYRYLWSNGKREPKTQNLKQDTFYLKVTDTNNCIENFKIPLIKDPMPLLFDSLGSEMLNCQDFTNINLSGIGGTKPYVYSIDSGISFRSQKIFRVSEARLYHVQIMDANKCLTRDTHRVKGTEKIEIEVYPKDTIVGMGEPVELGYRYIKGDSTKVQSFIWKPGDGLSCTDCRNPIATPYVPMIYTIEVIYNDNCYHSDNARIRHTLDELFIPNAFSPDGPNIENQTLRIYSNNIYKAKLSIFNRWGEKIFESHEAHRIGWDGTFKGKKLNYDVFVYSAEIIYLSGRKVVKSGEVTLIR